MYDRFASRLKRHNNLLTDSVGESDKMHKNFSASFPDGIELKRKRVVAGTDMVYDIIHWLYSKIYVQEIEYFILILLSLYLHL